MKYQPAVVHLDLDQRFHRKVEQARFPKHVLRYRNDRAAGSVGLDGLDEKAWLSHFGRFEPLEANLTSPLALCYHGHQFGHYNPDIGDGRGFLFAQMRDDAGRVMDLGTKGSGTTPFSRTADGRLTLKGAVREILATEMLEALGVDTSRTLSVIETGEALERHDEPSPTRSAVLVRLSHGHIRIGSFQRLRYMEDKQGLEVLMRHVARHYYSAQTDATAPVGELAAQLLGCVAARVADTAGGWYAAGFVHGVLNTDNFNITGESFDYGPWRFMPQFDRGHVAAYFDQTGRYAYGRQAEASLWALCRLADCFLEFAETEALESRLAGFYANLGARMQQRLCWRLGVSAKPDQEERICGALFAAAGSSKRTFAGVIHDWYGGRRRRGTYDGDLWRDFAASLEGASALPQADDAYFEREDPVDLPLWTVEALWAPIAEKDDWGPLNAMIDDIREWGARLRGGTVPG